MNMGWVYCLVFCLGITFFSQPPKIATMFFFCQDADMDEHQLSGEVKIHKVQRITIWFVFLDLFKVIFPWHILG